GAFSLTASNNTDASAVADGSAAKGELEDAVGVAVAINVAHATDRALVDTGATVTGDGATVSAQMKDVGGNAKHNLGASATSGASAKDIGVAGSFALSVSGTTTESEVKGTINSGTGVASLTASNAGDSAVSASASSTGNTGVGASFAINVADNSTRATLA